MSDSISTYNGTIRFHRVLKSNLPSKSSGKDVYFVLNNATDTIGEIWVTDSDGNVKCFSVSVDVSDLQSQIGVLCDDRGYKSTKNITSLDDLNNGKYRYSGTIDSIDGTWIIECTVYAGTAVQVATLCWAGTGITRGVQMCRYKADGTYKAWSVVGSVRIPFICTAKPYYKIDYQNCFVQNGIPYIDLEVSKLDASSFTNANWNAVFSTPFTPTITSCPLDVAFLDKHNGDYCQGTSGSFIVSTSGNAGYGLTTTSSNIKVIRVKGAIL